MCFFFRLRDTVEQEKFATWKIPEFGSQTNSRQEIANLGIANFCEAVDFPVANKNLLYPKICAIFPLRTCLPPDYGKLACREKSLFYSKQQRALGEFLFKPSHPYIFQTIEDLEEKVKKAGIEIAVRTSFLTDPTNAVRNLKVCSCLISGDMYVCMRLYGMWYFWAMFIKEQVFQRPWLPGQQQHGQSLTSM